LADSAVLDLNKPAMKTFVAVFVLALLTIAFEVYSDAALTSAEVGHAAPDPVSAAIGHASKGG
jgi:hypothetical protein